MKYKTSVSYLFWLTVEVFYLDSTNSKPHGVLERKTLLDKGGQMKHRSPKIEAI